jgi:TIR domain
VRDIIIYQKQTVIINYSDKDIQYAEKLYDILQAVGFQPWMKSKSILVGQHIYTEMTKAIKNSRYFIALFSSTSVLERGYIQQELKFALNVLDEFPESEVFILPIRLDECEIPYEQLRDKQYADLFPNWQIGTETVLKSLGVEREKIKDVLEGGELERIRPANKQGIFVSYSHKDRRWLERLQVHLKPLIRDLDIVIWDDTKIKGGTKWKEEIKSAISNAKIVVLLISADFMASDFISTNELPPILANARNNGTIILPVILSTSWFSQDRNLSQFQAANRISKPLNLLPKAQQERDLYNISLEISSHFKE